MGGSATADQGDDLIEMAERDMVALQNMCSLLDLAKLVVAPTNDHLMPMLEKDLQDALERQERRSIADEPKEHDPKVGLKRCQLIQTTKDGLRVLASLEVDDDAKAFPVRLVTHIRDAGQPPILHQLGDLLDELRLIDLIRDLLDDEASPTFLLLRLHPSPHNERPSSALVRVLDPLAADDHAAGGKIRARNDFQQGLEFRVRAL